MKGSTPGTAVHGGTRLIRGVAILGLAAAISKLLGTLQKIPLQNLAGDEAYGIYSAVYPFYVLVLFLATAGLPAAVSKLVSEQAALGNWREARRIYRLSSYLLTGTGIAAFLFLYAGAGLIASWIGSAQAEQALRSVSFALLIVPLMAASRGYYQGLQNMIPTAVSQVVEQTVRVAVMIALLLYLTRAGASSGTIAAGAAFGSAAGAAAGLAVMLWIDMRDRPRRLARIRTSSREARLPASVLMRSIIRYAMPVALGSIVVPIINMIDSFTLPRLLVISQGLSGSEALHEFGIYARGLPLVQLVSMLFSAMSAALVPSLSEAKVQGQEERVRRRADLTLWLTWLVGLAASAGLMAVSLPVNIMLFTDASGTVTMMIVAWTAVFSSLNVVSTAILQGISQERLPAIHLLIAAVLKVILNILLIPVLGISGAAWSGVIAYAAASLLNIRAIMKHIGLRRGVKEAAGRPLLAVITMVICILIVYSGLTWLAGMLGADAEGRGWNTINALVLIPLGAAVFGFASLASGAIGAAELMLLPGAGEKLVPLLRRLRLLRGGREDSAEDSA